MPDFDPAVRARESYELAYARAQLARSEWAKAGEPFTMVRPSGLIRIHPLWSALREAEADAGKFLERARVRHRGPAPAAVVQADIGQSPAQRLRALPPPS